MGLNTMYLKFNDNLEEYADILIYMPALYR